MCSFLGTFHHQVRTTSNCYQNCRDLIPGVGVGGARWMGVGAANGWMVHCLRDSFISGGSGKEPRTGLDWRELVP